MKIKLTIIGFCLLLISIIGGYQLVNYSDGKLHIVFCDVGQGDGIYIRTPNGTDIVIDAGRDDKILECLSSNMPFWDKEIELVFATHPDADHISGFVPILESYTVKSYNTVEVEKDTRVFLKINNLLKEKGISPRFLKLGDIYRLSDGVAITTHWPSKEFIAVGDVDTNRYSLVQTIKYKDFDVLLTGDIDFDILNRLFPSGLDVEIFKLSHHGSRTGVDSTTFTLIKPQLSIISAGKNNSYGHPHPLVLSELEKYKLKHLRTDELGDIEIETDGNKFSVSY